jgi:hypothetical protein
MQRSLGPLEKMKAIISASFALVIGTQLFATDYYINSATGTWGNPGTQAAPLPSYAALGTLNPGDTVYLARGTSYSDPYWEITQSGTATQPIVITSYGTGAPPVISNPGNWYIIRLTGDYLVLDGVTLQNALGNGAVIWGNHCTIQNCEITDTGIGVVVGGNPGVTTYNATVKSNYIHDEHMIYNDPVPDNNDSGANGILITTCSDVEISWNRIRACKAQSDDYGWDGGAFEFYGPSSGVEIHHNWCDYNNGVFEVGAPESGDTISNVRIYYNLFEQNGLLGSFHLAGATGGYPANISDFRIQNNTVVDTTTNVSNSVIGFDGTGGADQLSLTNNIFYYLGFQQFTTAASIVHTYNLYWGSPIGYTPSSSEMVADPQFVSNPGNYQLQSTSPAINAGTPLGYTYDRIANPIVGAPDLGAFEHQ